MCKKLEISSEISLRLLQEKDSESLFRLTNDNRQYLKKWLPWLDNIQKEEDTLNFIKSSIIQFEKNLGPQYAIIYSGYLSGVVGFHPIDHANKIAGIGYWLSKDKQGNGIITKCCKALIKLAFEKYGINRIQIPIAENNKKSRAIPERLGFSFEGIMREREYLYGKFVNHAMYSLLRSDYNENI